MCSLEGAPEEASDVDDTPPAEATADQRQQYKTHGSGSITNVRLKMEVIGRAVQVRREIAYVTCNDLMKVRNEGAELMLSESADVTYKKHQIK